MSQSSDYFCESLQNDNEDRISAEADALIGQMKKHVRGGLNVKFYQKSLSTFLKISQESFTKKCEKLSMHKDFQQNLSSSRIFSNVKVVFDHVLVRCSKQEEEYYDLSNHFIFLQSLVQLIEMLCHFLDQLIQHFADCKIVNLIYTDSTLPDSVLHIIQQSYDHCHSSEKVYGSNFESLSELLGELFRRTYTLQKSFSSIFTKISQPELDDQLTQNYCVKICSLLFQICKVVSDMDNTLLGSTWKLLISFMSKCKELILENIQIIDYIEEIVRNVIIFSKQCKTTTDSHLDDLFGGDVDLMKHIAIAVRMATFFLGLLANILFEFCPILTDEICAKSLFALTNAIENLKSLFVVLPGSSRKVLPSTLRKVINGHFLKEFDKCISLLAPTKQFQNEILCCDPKNNIDPTVKVMISFRLVRTVNNGLCDIDIGYLCETDENKISILALLFQLQKRLYPYLLQSAQCFIDDVTTDEQPLLRNVISNCLSCCVANISPSKLFSLETFLLDQVLGDNPYNFLLAVDLWCSLLKLVSADRACQYVKYFMKILNHSSFNRSNTSILHRQLGALVSRTFELLPLEQQRSLLNSFPLNNDANTVVWLHLGMNLLNCAPDGVAILNNVVSLLVDKIVTWRNNGCAIVGLPLLISSMRLATTVLRKLQRDHKQFRQSCSSLSMEVVKLWKTLPLACEAAPHAHNILLSTLAHLTSCLMSTSFHHGDMIQILQKANRCVQNLLPCIDRNATELLLYCFMKLLTAIGPLPLSAELVSEVTSLWRNVLTHATHENGCWLLQFKFLEGFETFSKVTKHPDIFRQICSNESDPEIRDMIKAHLKRELARLKLETVDLTNILVPVSKPSVSSSESAPNCELVHKIIGGVKELQTISAKNLNENEISLLRDSVTLLQQFLSTN